MLTLDLPEMVKRLRSPERESLERIRKREPLARIEATPVSPVRERKKSRV